MLRFARNRRTTEDSIDAILARLQQLHPKTIDLSLGRILSESKALCLGGTRRAAERPMALGVASGILAAT